MQEIVVGINEANQRLDKLLAKFLNKASKSFFYKMLRKKNIVLNDRKAEGNEILVLGDVVKLYLAEDTISKFRNNELQIAKGNLAIVYEDTHILIVNKPVGMLSQKANRTDVSIIEYVIGYLVGSGHLEQRDLEVFHPSVCNRLDRNTSGLIVAGKTLPGLQAMGEMFREHKLRKYYRCLVVGVMKEKSELDGWLKKDKERNHVTISQKEESESSYIKTKYIPLWSKSNVTLLEVQLITGKTHQIRAHLASIHHPIIGDYKYGIKRENDCYKNQYGLTHQLLHAQRLELPTCEGVLEKLSNKVIMADEPKLFQRICKDKRGSEWEHGTEEGSEVLH